MSQGYSTKVSCCSSSSSLQNSPCCFPSLERNVPVELSCPGSRFGRWKTLWLWVNMKFKGSLGVFSGLSASVSGVRQPFCVKDEKSSACLFGKENPLRLSKVPPILYPGICCFVILICGFTSGSEAASKYFL